MSPNEQTYIKKKHYKSYKILYINSHHFMYIINYIIKIVLTWHGTTAVVISACLITTTAESDWPVGGVGILSLQFLKTHSSSMWEFHFVFSLYLFPRWRTRVSWRWSHLMREKDKRQVACHASHAHTSIRLDLFWEIKKIKIDAAEFETSCHHISHAAKHSVVCSASSWQENWSSSVLDSLIFFPHLPTS